METWDSFVLTLIGRNLSRIDCISWSRCSKQLHQQVGWLCHLRLTSQQATVVDKILQLTAENWLASVGTLFPDNHGDFPAVTFPASHCISTGPSTGKTVIALYAAARMLALGKRVLLSAPLKLCPQWESEHSKFAARLELPALRILHPKWSQRRIDKETLSSLVESNTLLLVPSSLLNSWFGPHSYTLGSSIVRAIEAQRWDLVLIDEAIRVPISLMRMSFRRSLLHAIALNASRSGPTLADHLVDVELGRLPSMSIEVSVCPLAVIRDSCLDIVQRERKALGNPKKLLILSNDYYPIQVNGWVFKHYIVGSSRMKKDLEALSIFDERGGQRAMTVQRFAEAKSACLLAPLDYMARGFDLKCDAVIVVDVHGQLSHDSLLQLIGRVRRVESPFEKVSMRIVQSAPISAREVGFFPLVFTETNTDQLLRSAKAFEKMIATGYRWVAENGKRQKVTIHSGDLILLLQQQHPEAAKLIQHYEPTRLSVGSL